MAVGFAALAAGVIAAAQGGQQHLLAFQGRIGVIAALHIGAEEAGEIDALTAGAETGVLPSIWALTMVSRASAIWLATVRFQISS